MDERYKEDHPEIENLPPEAMSIIAEILPRVKTLREKYGLSLSDLDKFFEVLERGTENE